MVYDGVEITVRKVIHTEDYRLRLISLRVRPGAGLSWAVRMRDRDLTDSTDNRASGSTVAELKACITPRIH